MRSILFIACLCMLPKLHGQNFAKVGTRWFYLDKWDPINYWDWDYDPSIRDAYYFHAVADTLIAGKLCQKVEQRYISHINWLTFPQNPDKYFPLVNNLYFLNENNKVYFYKNEGFHLIYDFSLREGDSICVADYDLNQNCGMNRITDTIMGDFGNEKRIISFSQMSELSEADDIGYFLPVIDGVGGERFLLPIGRWINDSYAPYSLWCYYQDSTVYDRGKGYCANWLKFVEEAEAEIAKLAVQEIKFYPNPVTGISKLEFPNPNNTTRHLLVYNALGQLVRKEETTSYYLEISSSQLGAGVYHYRLLDENQNELKKNKFVSH